VPVLRSGAFDQHAPNTFWQHLWLMADSRMDLELADCNLSSPSEGCMHVIPDLLAK
jgi:hypothetical protein